ncbi:venom nerve growth factor 2 [Plakobranchus ocellatus]|uniref:Venom nerve growth factor 2 n=1 Tax=Plakobranchus ocellatus TaxID=259542 RepID=A0AAV4CV00_9GAST|nr:venom nerve growth factor 2 [Plakobranchus ocellatus]
MTLTSRLFLKVTQPVLVENNHDNDNQVHLKGIGEPLVSVYLIANKNGSAPPALPTDDLLPGSAITCTLKCDNGVTESSKEQSLLTPQASHTVYEHGSHTHTKRAFHEEVDGDDVETELGALGNKVDRDFQMTFALAPTTGGGRKERWAGQEEEIGGEDSLRMDCCPSEVHLVHPRGGISREGRLLELYRDHRTVQKFYQTTCKSHVRDRPCHLIKEELRGFSRCVQKYSFVYAFVRDFNVSERFRLDFIRLKSGCACEVEL